VQDSNEIAKGFTLRWMYHPEKFVQDVIFACAPKGDGPTKQQIQGLIEVGKIARAKHKAYLISKKDWRYGKTLSDIERRYARKRGLAIRSGHGVGKDAFLSWVFFWLFICFGTEKVRGRVTANNQPQLQNILWPEFRTWIRYGKDNSEAKGTILSETIEVENEKIYVVGRKGEAFLEARTANIKTNDENEQAEALAGAHGDFMILAADEASGLPKGVFKPLEGAMTGAMNFAILIGNGTRGEGYFYDCFHSDKDRWVTLHWNAEDSEIVNQDKLEDDRRKYGYESNWYRIRVRGEFPLSSPDVLIPLDLIEDAVGREIVADETDPVIFGCDVSREGVDNSIIFPRQGGVISEAIKTVDRQDGVDTAGWININMADKTAAVACVDVIGIGASVVDHLKRVLRQNVIAVDVRQKPYNEQRFYNRRAELYWAVKDRFFDKTICIPDDDELVAELSTIKFKYNERSGKLMIESKADRRKRNLPSPDKAEALMLSFAARDEYYRIKKDAWSDEEDPWEEQRRRGEENSWMTV